MDFDGLTEDQKARIRTCESADELRAIAEEQGLELSDDQLEAVSGGVVKAPVECGNVCYYDPR